MPDSSLKQQLKVITIPVFIEIALVMLLGAVDTVMLSHNGQRAIPSIPSLWVSSSSGALPSV